LKPIDIEKLKRDRLQLIGEAAYYESQGESLFLDPALWAAAAVEQEARRVKDAWEDLLRDKMFLCSEIVDGEERVASAYIMESILQIFPGQLTSAHGMRLSTVMKNLGWQRKPNNNVVLENGKVVKGYWRPSEEEPTPRQLKKRKKADPLPARRADRI
jgi:hypothetical protein